MEEKTPNLDLFLLKPNQLQKEVSINEAIIRLDAISSHVIKSVTATIPPEEPEDGDLYFVPQGASMEWGKYEYNFALFSNGWRFFRAKEGFFAWIIDQQKILIYLNKYWRPIINTIESPTDSTKGK